jgi:hypothetical protein
LRVIARRYVRQAALGVDREPRRRCLIKGSFVCESSARSEWWHDRMFEIVVTVYAAHTAASGCVAGGARSGSGHWRGGSVGH